MATVELLAFLWQLRPTMSEQGWAEARRVVQETTKANDLIVFAPDWVDPVGREHFGDDLMTVQRSAYADTSRFEAITEVGWNGYHHAATRGWTPIGEPVHVGSLTIQRWRNPSYQAVIDDLLDHVTSDRLTVERVTRAGSSRCTYRKAQPLTGPLGFGPAAPAQRFFCPRGGWVGLTVLADTNYRPRHCIYAAPPGGSSILRLTFHGVHFGHELVLHHGLYVEAERDGKGPPVTTALIGEGKKLGEAVHRDGQGWTEEKMNTSELAGRTGDLQVDISSRSGNRRMYCFEATTR